MIFNSLEFAVFLPIVFLLYWWVGIKNNKFQNLFLVFASYVFYGWWDYRFLLLIFISTIVDYYIAQELINQKKETKRKLLLYLSVSVNLGILGFFKYYNFFVESLVESFNIIGVHISVSSLYIVLPVGISFYTFQTMSYTIDIYRNRLSATKDFFAFAAFVCFFPQLVAGPIERASNLLPQFTQKRLFDYGKATDGMRQILLGLFKKIVIADNCAEYANLIFNNYNDFNGVSLLIGAVFFALQIYGDFSGYSDIAIGTSRLFGINLKQNFSTPYFSRDIAEFWRRWHISLSTWFRDYLYIPLGGSRVGIIKKIRNTFLIFVVSGFWHGANWTFIIWGALNAIYFLPLLLLNRNRNNINQIANLKIFPSFYEFLSILLTFSLTVFAWIFFRCENLNHAFGFIGHIFSSANFWGLDLEIRYSSLIIVFYFAFEWVKRHDKHTFETLFYKLKRPYRWSSYILIIACIYYFGGDNQNFIYFQF